jgi:hypothetical protein
MKSKTSAVVAGLVAGALLGWVAHGVRGGSPPSGSAVAADPAVVPTPSRPIAPGEPLVARNATGTTRPASCDERLKTLEAELARAQAKLDEGRPPHERFERGAPDHASEQRLQPDVARVLGDLPHTVECHAGVCKVEVLVKDGELPSDDLHKKVQALQEDGALQHKTVGAEVSGGRLVRDPVSGESVTEYDSYFVVADPDVVRGTDLIGSAIAAFRASGAVADCGRRYPGANGTVDASVHVEPESGIEIETAGTIIHADAGQCIDASLRRALGRVVLPPKYDGGVVHTRFKLPVD